LYQTSIHAQIACRAARLVGQGRVSMSSAFKVAKQRSAIALS
jgi:hypothetical protein